MKQFVQKFAMTVAMLLSFLSASAYDFKVDGIYYNVTDATKHEVAVTNNGFGIYSGNINIPSTVTNGGTTYTVTSIGEQAFYGSLRLTSITIPNSVTSIGGRAFVHCESLTSITIPNSVTSIGDNPFSNCYKLGEINVDPENKAYASVDGVLFNKTITEIIRYPNSKSGTIFPIPTSVTSIANGAFHGCTGLTSITIPNAVTYIGELAFSYCSSLTSINIPNAVTSIGDWAFCCCRGLTSLTIPNSVTSIGYMVFDSCTGLTSITIPNSVTSIGEYAFALCKSLTSVTIPNSVTSIGSTAFNSCSGLIEINVDTANSFYASADGVLYNKPLTEIIQYPCGKPGTTFSIPNSVTSIGKYAFNDCTGLTSITIPNSVTTIGYYAFGGCAGLTSVTIPNSVTSIGKYAFNDCTGLVEINVDPGNSFYASVDGVLYNKNLTEIIQYPCGKSGTTFSIPNSVTSIKGCAFEGCIGLTSVTIPNSVTTIGYYAFGECAGLTSITIPGSVTDMGQGAFYGCPLKSVYCHWEEPLEWHYEFQSLFSDSCYEEGTLYVPKGCADKYRSTAPWSNFKIIVEDESLGVDDIMENQPTGGYIIYDLKGVLVIKTEDIDEVKRLPAGLYIVNGKKVLIR